MPEPTPSDRFVWSDLCRFPFIVWSLSLKFGYPPDLQEETVKTVLQQAELLCADCAVEPEDRTSR